MSLPHNIYIGLKVGALTVIQFTGSKNNQRIWLCACKCGNQIQRSTRYINDGVRKSRNLGCGCTYSENARKAGRSRAYHSFNKTKLKSIRTSMIARCTRRSCKDYPRYGGRCIKVCDQWLKSPLKFYKWAMANGYKDGLSIERKNFNGNYEPSNCIFIPISRQAANTCRSRKLAFNGTTMNVADWARHLGISPQTLSGRLNARGWSVERALSEPVAR